MAQCFRFDSWVRSATGSAVPGAQIFAIDQPANLPSSLQTGQPSPLVNVFSDANGLVPLSQPILTDGFGHAAFYMFADVAFTLAVYLGGLLNQYYPDQVAMGSSTGVAVTLQVNGTNNVVQKVLNLEGTAGITTADQGNGTVKVTLSNGSLPPSPQIGDTLRYNVNGDSVWDAVNAAPIYSAVWSVWGGPINPIGVGIAASGFSMTGGDGSVNPTATSGAGTTTFASASASTNTVAGWKSAENGNNSLIPFLAFYRWSFKFQLNDYGAGTRYWWGLCCRNIGSSLGTNSTAILGTTKLATDIPNSSLLGFRASGGTDSNFQAVAISAGVGHTVVDTGIPIDTAIHLFEMIPNSTGTSVAYFIDGNQVATISATLPAVSSTPDSLASMFWTGDNKNSNTAVSANYWYMAMSHKP